MARVLYGVMGNTYGHVTRSMAIASRLPEHEFYFVGGGRVAEVAGRAYPVMEVPVARTVHKRQRVSVSGTCGHWFRCVANIPTIRKRILELMERWQPEIALCDREFFTPLAARAGGLPCVSLDHSHLLRVCQYAVPWAQTVSWGLAQCEDWLFFDRTRHNLIVSFFRLPLKRCGHEANELLPPVLRPAVRAIQPCDGDHVLVYQTSPSFGRLIETLRKLRRPAIVYGFRNQHRVEGNLTFKPFDPHAILEDLARCAYAVTNGGHNLICEALYFGKPLLCFPIACHFEQYLNSWHVRELGYGDFSSTRHPLPALFETFETRLADYRAAIRKQFVDGTDAVVHRVRELIAQHR